MPLAVETVVKQLTDSGIVVEGKLANFVPPKAQPKDGESLVRDLYKQNLLTKFQAQQVAAGRFGHAELRCRGADDGHECLPRRFVQVRPCGD